MGLDITAYRQLQGPVSQDQDEDGPWLSATDSAFIARTDGLEEGAYASAAEEFDFRAGSYGGYNQWRDELAKLAGYPAMRHAPSYGPPRDLHAASAWQADSGPFWELINFSDCEGTIGPKTSAKLAADFAAHQEKADAHAEGWFRELYAKWRKAFEMAADGGAVSFH